MALSLIAPRFTAHPSTGAKSPVRNLNGATNSSSPISVSSIQAIKLHSTGVSLASSSSPALGYRRNCNLFLRRGRTAGAVKRNRVVCYAGSFNPFTLQCISAASAIILMLSKESAIKKSFLAPLFVLQVPLGFISWIKGEYGIWTAFLGLLVRLFYFMPGELDLPFTAMLLVIVAPFQYMKLRESPTGEIISLLISLYLGYQHFSRAGSLRRAFDQGGIISTLAIILVVLVPCLLLFK